MSRSVLVANMSRSVDMKVSCQKFDVKGSCEESNSDQSGVVSRGSFAALDVGEWCSSPRIGRPMCVWMGGKYDSSGKGGEGCLVLGVEGVCCVPVVSVPVEGNGCPGLGVASSCCVLGVRIASPTVDTFSRFGLQCFRL